MGQSQLEIHFVTGKGGVGKSLVAAGLAKKLSEGGSKVLLAEFNNVSFFGPLLGEDIGFHPKRSKLGFDVSSFDAENSLRDYVLHLVKIERVYNLFFENRVMRAFINIAPGLKELALLGKLTSGMRKVGPPFDYEKIVVDSFATGHFIALLKAPISIQSVIKKGPMGEQTRDMTRILKDPSICKYNVVVTPEELPVVEGTELYNSIKELTGVEPNFVINKKLTPPLTTDEIETVSSKEAGPLKSFASYLLRRMKSENSFLNQISSKNVISEIPMVLSLDSEELINKIKDSLSVPS